VEVFEPKRPRGGQHQTGGDDAGGEIDDGGGGRGGPSGVEAAAEQGSLHGAGARHKERVQQQPPKLLHLHGVSAAASAAAGVMYASWMTPAQKAEQRAKVRAAERRRERDADRRAGVRSATPDAELWLRQIVDELGDLDATKAGLDTSTTFHSRQNIIQSMTARWPM